jgi:hypothetical protein
VAMVEEPFRKSANALLIPPLAGRGFAAILTLEKAIRVFSASPINCNLSFTAQLILIIFYHNYLINDGHFSDKMWSKFAISIDFYIL